MIPLGMDDRSSFELTRMLRAWSEGDASALEYLTPIVYAELHRLARRNMACEWEGTLLQPTALVNEAFVRLMGGAPGEWANRTHFFAVSARVMRQILIDFTRAQNTRKRGNRPARVDLSGVRDLSGKTENPVDLIDLHTALNELACLDPRQAQVVELRYFGGLENPEIAEVLGVSEPTVVRDWRKARAWLYGRLGSPEAYATKETAANSGSE